MVGDPYVSVIGTEEANQIQRQHAYEIGEELAQRGYRMVCGGRGGVMEAASRGHRAGGGAPIGILPRVDRKEANEYLEVAIVTGLGQMRNSLVVANGTVVVAIGGRYGTLSEIAFALSSDTPVIGLDTHDIEGVIAVESVEEAIEAVENSLSD